MLNNQIRICKQLQNSYKIYHDSIKKRAHAMKLEEKQTSVIKYMFSKIKYQNESFYKLGFRSYQKSKLKKNICQWLRLRHKQTTGSCHISQFWNDSNMVYYLRQHKMYLNKKRLLRERSQMKDQQNMPKKNVSTEVKQNFNYGITTKKLVPIMSQKIKNEKINFIIKELGIIQKQVKRQKIKFQHHSKNISVAQINSLSKKKQIKLV